jgi:hypothetical protein
MAGLKADGSGDSPVELHLTPARQPIRLPALGTTQKIALVPLTL